MSCLVCGQARLERRYPGISGCSECGTLAADVSLSDEDIERLYGKDYFFGAEYSDYLADRETLKRNFTSRLDVLEELVDGAAGKELLEIGCAYGFFLDLARKRFKSVSGIDISADAVRYARQRLDLDVLNADFLAHDFGGRSFDAICLWDTIEHLREPHLYVEKASRLLRPGGLLAFTTGDVESVNARWRKSRWRLLHPPTHLHYFSKKTIGRMLERHGLQVVYNRYCGYYRTFDLAAHRILGPNRKGKALYSLLRKTPLLDLPFYLNLYDIFYVAARKR